MVKLAALAAGDWGVTGEDRMASVSASLAVASANCDVAVSLQVLCTFCVGVRLLLCGVCWRAGEGMSAPAAACIASGGTGSLWRCLRSGMNLQRRDC